jgi:hypothetical protein
MGPDEGLAPASEESRPMRPMTRRSFGAASLSVLGAAFSCSFGDDEDEDKDDDKPNDKPAKRRRQ